MSVEVTSKAMCDACLAHLSDSDAIYCQDCIHNAEMEAVENAKDDIRALRPAHLIREWADRERTLGRLDAAAFDLFERCAEDIG